MPKHIPVLLNEVIDVFKEIPSGYIVDCTTGLAGHSRAILENNPNIKMICLDRDIEALEIAKENLKEFENRVEFSLGAYSKEIEKFKDYNIVGLLADIGVSSLQLDKSDRGFRFDSEEFDMRMDRDSPLKASDVVNQYSLSELERIFKDYGEIREYKKMARVIQEARKDKKIETNIELASLIARNFNKAKIHPATTAFQAIRIEVNDELGELNRLLTFLEKNRKSNLKVAIISFHSLEDKIVKNRFRDWTKNCICSKEVFRCECGNNNSLGKNLTKKPIIPTPEEIKANARSRSSKMRLFQFKEF